MITIRRLAAAQYKGLQAIDLRFPERGSFLIEGRNEAGKSTLFDAVYFALYGVPLVGDTAAAIHYGGDEAEVRLDLDVGGTSLSVRRRTRQTAKTLASQAELEIEREGEREVVKGQRPVTARLQQELGGLTDEALLNSCLVAQKQLGRLETLSRASREEALTILLNLGKLSDVQARVRVRPEDEERLRRARAHVELARHGDDLDRLQQRRAHLLRQRRLLDAREGAERLRALQAALDESRAGAAAHQAALQQARERLAQIGALRERAAGWQQASEAARRVVTAEQERTQAEEALGTAQAAAAALPSRRLALERCQAARDQAQALAERLGLLRQLDARGDQLARRLAEREHLGQRAARLETELAALRRQRRELSAQVQQLAPLAGEQEQSRARLAGLAGLAGLLETLQEQRRELEDAQAQAVARAEADARRREAVDTLEAALVALAGHERLRQADLERRRLAQVRECLEEWRRLTEAAAAAEQARRLLDDLALAVTGVERVAVPEAEGADGLHLSLLVDHPLTGARRLRLRLWSDGVQIVESRAATESETQGLQAGALPTLSAAGDDGVREEARSRVSASLAALGEQAPKRPGAHLQRRLDELEAALAAPAGAYDEEGYLTARGAASAAEALLKQAETAAAALPEAALLAAHLTQAEREIERLEREAQAAAVQLQVAAPNLDQLPAAVAHEAATEQRRGTELAAKVGQANGLQGQLAELDRSGKERARELAEAQSSLATDSEEQLQEEQRLLATQRAALEQEAAALRQGIERSLDGAAAEEGEAAAAELWRSAQARADEVGRQVAVLEEQAGALEGAAGRLEAAQEALGALTGEMETALEAMSAVDSAAGLPEKAQPEALAALAARRGSALLQEAAALDEPATRAAEQEAQRALGAAESGARRAADDARAAAAQIVRVVEQLGQHGQQTPGTDAPGVTVPDQGNLADLADLPDLAEREPTAAAAAVLAACPEAAGALPAGEEIEAQLGGLEQQVGRLEQARQDALATLGSEAPLGLEEAEQALRAQELDLHARRRAQEIIGTTRQRMINKVLPDTITNTCLLLPLLTAGRYRYAQLTPDYRLQVWDERKHGFVEKNLYSGGTQDQFSLALRLGFALAALPRELGTSPGFLFLDEPLSSFDQDRAAALVDLLTHGQIATFFHQVFLISHSQAFDPRLFSHHISMEEGRVASSTLPAG